MGHLVNATAFRLGWNSVWSDQWFMNKLFYSNFLHNLLRVRFFLIFYFYRKKWDKISFFFSHFFLVKKFKTFYINIFFYDGKFEDEFEDLWSRRSDVFKEFNSQVPLFNRNKKKKKRTRKIIYEESYGWLFLVFFDSLNKYSLFNFLNQFTIYYLVFKLNHNFVWGLKKTIASETKMNYIIRNGHFFRLTYFLYFFYLLLFNHFDSTEIEDSVEEFVNQEWMKYFYYYGFSNGSYWSLFHFISKYLIFVNSLLTNNLNGFKVNFFLISNDSVTAKFLSRFIAKKFKQNYGLRQLLNPIKKELCIMSSFSIYSLSEFSRNLFRRKLICWETNFLSKILLNKYLKTLNQKLKLFLVFNVLDYGTFISVNMLTLYHSLFSVISSIQLRVLHGKQISQHNIFYILFFFEKIEYFFDAKYSFLPKMNLVNINNESLVLKNKIIKNLSYKFYLHFFTNNFSLVSKYLEFNYCVKCILFINNNLNKYLKFNYWKFNYHFRLNVLKVNNLKTRIKRRRRDREYRGFKIHCLGRFTRSQRAKSYWASYGKVPLNTINTAVDYGSYTIPLKNSAINIKIWLNKDNYRSSFFFRLI